MAFDNQQVYWGLRAEGSLSRSGVAGTALVGVRQPQRIEIPDANIAYSFSAVSTGGTDAVQLTQSTGQVVATVGSPTINDEGVDFEGEVLDTTALTHALLIEYTKVLGNLTVVSSDNLMPDIVFDKTAKLQLVIPVGTVGLGTITCTFSGIGSTVKITVLAATS
jgi:hypothetical protein